MSYSLADGLTKNAVFSDITYTNCEIGFLIYTGSVNQSLSSNSTKVYYLDLVRMNFSYNNF